METFDKYIAKEAATILDSITSLVSKGYEYSLLGNSKKIDDIVKLLQFHKVEGPVNIIKNDSKYEKNGYEHLRGALKIDKRRILIDCRENKILLETKNKRNMSDGNYTLTDLLLSNSFKNSQFPAFFPFVVNRTARIPLTHRCNLSCKY